MRDCGGCYVRACDALLQSGQELPQAPHTLLQIFQ